MIRSTPISEAITRARSMIGAPIRYRLSDHNGGRDPHAADPASHWVDDRGIARRTCDCAGFVAWALGYARFQPAFPHWDGWINTNSALHEAATSGAWFEHLAAPEPGCLIVFPSLKRVRRVGHVGLIVAVRPTLRVVHCSAGNDRRFGYAIAETDDSAWRDSPGALPKATQYLRYLRSAAPLASVA